MYRDRILRGTGADRFYSADQLGAVGADLGALACFLQNPGNGWRRLVVGDQAWLLT